MRNWKTNHIRGTLLNRSLQGTGYYTPRLPRVQLKQLSQLHQQLFPSSFDLQARRARLDAVYSVLLIPEVREILRDPLRREEPVQAVFDSFFDQNAVASQVRGTPAFQAKLRREPGVRVVPGLAGVRTVTVTSHTPAEVGVDDNGTSRKFGMGSHTVLSGMYRLSVAPASGTTGTVTFSVWVPDVFDPAAAVSQMEHTAELFAPVPWAADALEKLGALFRGSRVVSTRAAAGLAALFYQLEARRG